LEKNIVSLGPKKFQHVPLSHDNCHIESKSKNTHEIPKNVIEHILKVIREENGTISLGYALQSACQRCELVRDFLRNEKELTQRDSRTVQHLFVEIIRHKNIKIIKRKPELVVKWIENENENDNEVTLGK
jgi:hypothetical protein